MRPTRNSGRSYEKDRKISLSWLFSVSSLLPGTGNAQAAKTGILTGTVVEEQGQPLPGVEVTISSPSLMTPRLVRAHQ